MKTGINFRANHKDRQKSNGERERIPACSLSRAVAGTPFAAIVE